MSICATWWMTHVLLRKIIRQTALRAIPIVYLFFSSPGVAAVNPSQQQSWLISRQDAKAILYSYYKDLCSAIYYNDRKKTVCTGYISISVCRWTPRIHYTARVPASRNVAKCRPALDLLALSAYRSVICNQIKRTINLGEKLGRDGRRRNVLLFTARTAGGFRRVFFPAAQFIGEIIDELEAIAHPFVCVSLSHGGHYVAHLVQPTQSAYIVLSFLITFVPGCCCFCDGLDWNLKNIYIY